MNTLVAKNRDDPATVINITPMDMLERAVSSNAGVEVISKLMDLQDRWQASHARRSFDEAMAAAKAEIPVIMKNREVDFTSPKGRTNYRHEDLAEIARTVDPILTKHGLSYRFRTTSQPNEPVSVTCIVSHRHGHSEENTLSAGRDESGNKNSIQAVASTITYLQRYTLKAALGLAASNDDDGSASEKPAFITSDQLQRIIALADDVKADKERFCKYLKVGSLAEILAPDFDHAINLLEAKRSK
ncbi:MAG TPA: ERF family protein [Nitrospira sp.]|nr:ERF family protein [Nitrospira sp.]